MLPNPAGTDLYLKIDYTLVSRDDSKEEIEVKGAQAVVPAIYAQWQPNYTYTYLFKISDNTDGHIGGVQGLYPITLDAVVNVDADGTQETVTTVTEPEPTITTYQNGSDYAATGAYDAGDIYVVVCNEIGGVVTLTAANAKLYEASVTVADPVNKPANITEAAAENAIVNPSGAKDENDNPLTVTEINPSILTFVSSIPGIDGNLSGAKFTATASKTYVFQYMKEPAVYYTAEQAAAINAAITGLLSAGVLGDNAEAYNAAMGTTKTAEDVITDEEAAAYNVTLGYKTTSDIRIPAKYQYKVIKVKAATP